MSETKRLGVKRLIFIPLILLGIISVTTNLIAIYGISRINKTASAIVDEYIEGAQTLADIETGSQSIHKLALSHIVATNLTGMLDISTSIKEENDKISDLFLTYEQYVTDETEATYQSLLVNYKTFTSSLANLLAYSVSSNKTEAYSYANNELADAASAMISDIDILREATNAITEEARNELSNISQRQRVTALTGMFFSMIATLSVIVLVRNKIVKPITDMSEELSAIVEEINNREGNLTRRIHMKDNNEIGDLAQGMNTFLEKLQHIFLIIRMNTDKMDLLVGEVLGSVNTSKDSASDLSALTEELSATMEEVSSHTAMINQNANEVRNDVSNIAEKSAEIDEYSKGMKTNADNMQYNARTQLEEIDSKVSGMLVALNQAIEESKSVDKVSNLTNEILNISSQSNLLALNASIEAARAGEAGKGFAVVAEEIRNLADSSRETANNINQINGVVTDAVYNLSGNANALIEFLTKSILPGFESFIEVGNQYKKDADYVEDVMNNFADKTEELKATMNNIAISINTITTAIEDGVQGLNGAAESTQVLVTDMSSITERMNGNKAIAEELKGEAEIFKEI